MRPVTVQVSVPVVWHVFVPGVAVTTYEVTGDPLPFAVDHLTRAAPFSSAAVIFAGGAGSASGVTGADSEEPSPVPFPFVAFTEKLYVVPFVSPLTVHVSAPSVVQVLPGGVEVTAYPETLSRLSRPPAR